VVLVPKLPKLGSQPSLSHGQIKKANRRTFDCARYGAEPARRCRRLILTPPPKHFNDVLRRKRDKKFQLLMVK
jgi:hypothetical protein